MSDTTKIGTFELRRDGGGVRVRCTYDGSAVYVLRDESVPLALFLLGLDALPGELGIAATAISERDDARTALANEQRDRAETARLLHATRVELASQRENARAIAQAAADHAIERADKAERERDDARTALANGLTPGHVDALAERCRKHPGSANDQCKSRAYAMARARLQEAAFWLREAAK